MCINAPKLFSIRQNWEKIKQYGPSKRGKGAMRSTCPKTTVTKGGWFRLYPNDTNWKQPRYPLRIERINWGVAIYDGTLYINENEWISATLKIMVESHNYNVDENRLDTKEFIWHDPTGMKGKHKHN